MLLGYAGYFSTQGFQVAVFDRPCTFGSGCADEPAAYDFIADGDAVLTTLGERGATSTAVVGASFGGAVTIGACAVLRTSACVGLSPAQFDTYLDGAARPGDALTANNAMDASAPPCWSPSRRTTPTAQQRRSQTSPDAPDLASSPSLSSQQATDTAGTWSQVQPTPASQPTSPRV